mmetsp:Transcript_9087/g.16782  ORF Transcript_9087/g.16782 Transcript_9087/m.16782 type:complete len:141 (-) Transcript_9087:219-641(-)
MNNDKKKQVKSTQAPKNADQAPPRPPSIHTWRNRAIAFLVFIGIALLVAWAFGLFDGDDDDKDAIPENETLTQRWSRRLDNLAPGGQAFYYVGLAITSLIFLFLVARKASNPYSFILRKKKKTEEVEDEEETEEAENGER